MGLVGSLDQVWGDGDPAPSLDHMADRCTHSEEHIVHATEADSFVLASHTYRRACVDTLSKSSSWLCLVNRTRGNSRAQEKPLGLISMMPLSFPSRAVIVRLISLKALFLGLFASTYLLYVYVSHQPIVCGGSGGCEIVRLSEWAYVFGFLPRPLLGVAFYTFLLALFFVRVTMHAYPRILWRLMQLFVGIGVIESLMLFFVQWKELHAFCLWCLLSALASLVLAVCACADHPVDHDEDARAEELRWVLVSLVLLTAGFLFCFWMLIR